MYTFNCFICFLSWLLVFWLYQGIFPIGKPQDSHAYPHWGKTLLLSVPRLWQVILQLIRSLKTPEDSL